MKRRTLLRGLAVLGTGVSAGCVGANGEVPVTAPEPPPEIGDSGIDNRPDAGENGDAGGGGGDGGETPDQQRFIVPARRFRSDDDGDLLVVLTVVNSVDVPHEAVMTVDIGAGRKTFSIQRFVSLGPNGQREFEISVPVPRAEFEASPAFDVTFEPGKPATPIPEGTVTPYPEDRETATDGEPVETTTDSGTGTPTRTATETAVSGTAGTDTAE